MNTDHTHYDQRYFDFQQGIAQFGGWANRTKFADRLAPTDTVLDFGCSSGHLLAQLSCARRIGVEVNPAAIAEAKDRLDAVYTDVAEVPAESVDKIISNHALEHVAHPLTELQKLYRVLKPGGTIILVVPCETVACSYVPDDINAHLYSWSPSNLGNLLTKAGFKVESATPYAHKWPPHSYLRYARFGRGVFDLVCKAYARWDRSWTQVRAVAVKPLAHEIG